ncbi:TetR/AcrR family transcriptional regulator [Wukongibacter baidiensis]|uniref:TetR/AcrR family transcriptional regulator n=1 Tax=Wukongibacter baidiensis TaxID=1723361 RepID=UPI003D7F31E7
MARITDPTKLERIKKATMELVVKHGYRGTSISAIAKKAGVSTGYLYRHYEGKTDLIDDLIDNNFQVVQDIFCKTAEEKGTARDTIHDVVNMLFHVSISDPIHAKFLSVLVFDQNFEVRRKREEDRKVKKLVETVLRLGIKNGEIGPNTTSEEVVLALFTLPFSYITMNLDTDGSEEKFGKKQVDRITEIILNALK